MNVEIHATHIRPGLRVATIPGRHSGRTTPAEIDVANVERYEIDGTAFYRLTTPEGNSYTNLSGYYHLVSDLPDTMVTVLIDGAYTNGHTYKRTAAVPGPAEGETLDAWWDDVVFDETGDGVTADGSHAEATITAGPAALIGKTCEFFD